MKILINQIGYKLNQKKLAKIIGIHKNAYFSILNKKDNVVFKGTIIELGLDLDSNEFVSNLDFSDFNESGEFKICVDETFIDIKILEDPYNELSTSLVYALLMQKCGEEVVDKRYNIFSHGPCHNSLANIYSTEKYIDVSGGLHDAGDYGRYTVPGCKMVLDLLFAYEASCDKNILDIINCELLFLAKMQRMDGAVYHKVTTKNFADFIMPDKVKDELVVSPISTAATADFCATLALASIILPDNNDLYLKKSLAAVDFLENNKVVLFKNPKDITTGEYDDDNVRDELFLAYVGIYEATKNPKYLKQIKSYIRNSEYDRGGLGWENMYGYGEYLFLRDKLNTNLMIYKDIYNVFKLSANNILLNIKNKAFDIDPINYIWGSNSYVLNNALIVSFYNEIENSNNKDTLYNAINYLCGINSLDKSFITGFGYNPPMHPHHRPSIASKKVLKGMLVGGPCAGLYDTVAADNLKGAPSAKTYIDNTESYSTNEICIYWNSPLILVLELIKKS